MSSLYKKLLSSVEKTLKNKCRISSGDNILIALSGGSDSVFLFHILYALKDKLGFSIACAHLNHSLREEADAEECFVSGLCRTLGITLHTRKSDITKIASEQGISLETAGRNERYSFFDSLIKEYAYTKLATAHHLDDNAETILMHFIRGCSTGGLKGIEYSRNDGIIRPLLDITKKEIIDCCNEMHWDFAVDKSNFETLYTRNSVRLELIPKISEYNSNFTRTVTENSGLFAEDDDFINSCAKKIFDENYNNGLSEKIIKSHHPAIGRRLMQLLYKKSTGISLNISQEYILAMLSLKRSGQTISLPDNYIACLEYGIYTIKKAENNQNTEYEYRLNINEEIFIPDVNQIWILKKACKKTNNTFSTENDAVITVRNRRQGDKFFPIGMNGRKKLSDFFTDKKIPAEIRKTAPILTANGEIVNIQGIYRDRRFYNENCNGTLYTLEIHNK